MHLPSMHIIFNTPACEHFQLISLDPCVESYFRIQRYNQHLRKYEQFNIVLSKNKTKVRKLVWIYNIWDCCTYLLGNYCPHWLQQKVIFWSRNTKCKWVFTKFTKVLHKAIHMRHLRKIKFNTTVMTFISYVPCPFRP